ncbi:Hypothetical protein HVR_LOCUS506 [uncultured virus]|nr:Hypothetical protein HVR_LOCUS506 [uncultured virus]
MLLSTDSGSYDFVFISVPSEQMLCESIGNNNTAPEFKSVFFSDVISNFPVNDIAFDVRFLLEALYFFAMLQ